MTSTQLRNLWFSFFKKHGHSVIDGAPLIPENDPTVLFTTAGMHPLVPYLLGEKHPSGSRLANVQRCVRTGDIDEVGDDSHCTFFEMLGNWSLNDYFKEEMIRLSFEFLTSKDYLNIDKNRLAVSVFAGDESAPRDEQSAKIWHECGILKERIFYLPKENNWWGPAGQTGPCGPDTEMFIDNGQPPCSSECSPACNCGKYLEIWNDVFMQYNKNANGEFEPLAHKNVDTGMGLERALCILGGFKSVYETDVFLPIVQKIEQLSGKKASEGGEVTRAIRIIADHIRTAVFMFTDGVAPSNVERGYILRRLIRRAIRFARIIELGENSLGQLAYVVAQIYKDIYPTVMANIEKTANELALEEERFLKTIGQGMREFEKLLKYLVGTRISDKAAFKLYDTYGFPLEMTIEMARECGLTVDEEGFEQCFKQHQSLSQSKAGTFAGGLADNTEAVAKLHTATHLLHAGLKKVLNDNDVNQRGSNITEERLRFDFSFSRPMTADEIGAVEAFVNSAIEKKLDVVCEEMPLEKAKEIGAIGLFEGKYAEVVKVYSIEGFSMEICGGPHAKNTGELGRFVITKEQSSSAGVRRIKAELRQGG